ncbi:MAG TPA: aspartate--tRNA ligase [Candidatus Binatia bacterium]|nr:aspartate--tRNA ligase [Candidatus Binatia bacterium]
MASNTPQKVSCGILRLEHVGRDVEINGWVNRRRDHGGLIFIDVRDHDGITQAVFDPEQAEAFALAESLRSEDVIRVHGAVRRRPQGTENPRLATGDVEVGVHDVVILGRSKTPPFPISVDEDVDESLRLRFRYLDLRRARMQENMRVRHRLVKAMRDYFDELDFLEIETPCLIKTTPEGARDYLVPSRIHPGTFYALPQSPQILKQCLMIGGMGRYMQIARCFRDEDPRADRQPEFTQLDVELSFVGQEDIIGVMEGCMIYTWRKALGIELGPFPRMRHAEAIARFGVDKPDLRFGLELSDVAPLFAHSEFSLFRTLANEEKSRIAALRYPDGAALSRRDFDALTETAKEFGAKGLVWIALARDGMKSSIARFLDDGLVEKLRTAVGAENGDAILLVGDEYAAASDVAGKLRIEIGERCKLRDPRKFAFGWVLDFPLFERDAETGGLAPAHHPFTAPADGQEALIDSDPLAVRAQHYDMILNGYELGSGSIRIHSPALQKKIFELIGLTDEEIADRFGFFIEAFDYGAPPHGGMALGVDRIAMLACGETSIREVIAFPKNQMARDLMIDAPSTAPEKTLRELSLEVRAPAAKGGRTGSP